ncbi:MAG: AAA family ATPase [Alicyclobacillus sp.]|nr:AAA family ATPase [Alicyclobacillus sp.]
MPTAPKTPVSKSDVQRVISRYRDGELALSEALKSLSGAPLPEAPATAPAMNKERLLSIYAELDQLVGLEEVKAVVREIFALLYMQDRRQALHLRAEPVVLHMVFKGNPGTGKTTVARLLAQMFHECGLLEKGHLVEVERADLVGEYIGHTAQKTREMVKKALGGVLFIDEAYSLARGGERDFGRESIDALVKAMEDYRNQFIAIIAGYAREMDWFLSTNPGLPSRFPIHLQFPDYSVADLLRIARKTAEDRQYTLSPAAEAKLRRILEAETERRATPANARLVRNLVEHAIRLQAVRLFDAQTLTRQAAVTLQAEDFRLEGDAR